MVIGLIWRRSRHFTRHRKGLHAQERCRRPPADYRRRRLRHDGRAGPKAPAKSKSALPPSAWKTAHRVRPPATRRRRLERPDRPRARFLPAKPPLDRWLVSTPVTIAAQAMLQTETGGETGGEIEVRITAQRLQDGRTEFAIQQREGDGWSDRIAPRARFLPAEPPVDRWLVSTPVPIATPTPTPTPAPGPTVTPRPTATPEPTSVVLGDCRDGMRLQPGEGCRYTGGGSPPANVVLSVQHDGAICREGGPAKQQIFGVTINVDHLRICSAGGFERDDAFQSGIVASANADGSWTFYESELSASRATCHADAHARTDGHSNGHAHACAIRLGPGRACRFVPQHGRPELERQHELAERQAHWRVARRHHGQQRPSF